MERQINITKDFKLVYKLTKEKNKYKITCTEKNYENNNEEVNEVLFISTRRNAKKILEILAKNQVFPCHLQEIVKELMC